MLVGDSISFKTYDDFCRWIAGHNQRNGKLLPERSNRRAWDSATGDFKSDKHSEVVVFSGELDWCEPDQPGILKLKLNPLKMEKTCRFHRRFESDRFLSLTMPALTRPPGHLRLPSQPSLLRESSLVADAKCSPLHGPDMAALLRRGSQIKTQNQVGTAIQGRVLRYRRRRLRPYLPPPAKHRTTAPGKREPHAR